MVKRIADAQLHASPGLKDAPVLDLIEPMRSDREKFVRLAVAWFDRELTKQTRRLAS